MLLLPASGSDADSGPLHRTATVPPAPSSALLARLAVAAASLPDLPAAGAFLRDHPASAVVVATPGVLLGLQLPGDGALVERVQADLVLPLEREGVRFDPGLHDRLSPRAAAASAFSGAHPLALAFAGPSGAEILSRARAGLPFPPKSTKFAPKPPKGFLLTSTRSF
jgi:hypothetical protein